MTTKLSGRSDAIVDTACPAAVRRRPTGAVNCPADQGRQGALRARKQKSRPEGRLAWKYKEM